MSKTRIVLLTACTMVAFAANSLLCRMALRETHIDAASFTTFRLASGALTLWFIMQFRSRPIHPHGSWRSAIALFIYASAFSYAYLSLPASTGALLLFGAVQATMIGYGLWQGERLDRFRSFGLLLACAGLIGLMLPGLSAPSLRGAVLMLIAGISWGIYSLCGRGGTNPIANTASNFIRTLPFAVLLSLVMSSDAVFDSHGIGYALASGALASGLGYAVWYSVLPGLRATSAAIVQLSVPVIAALGGAVVLHEAITQQLVLSAIAILGGIALVVVGRLSSK